MRALKTATLILSILVGAWLPTFAGAELLIDQIENLPRDAVFKKQLDDYKNLDTVGLATELELLAQSAAADLAQAQAEGRDTEIEFLRKHADAVARASKNFRKLAELDNFGVIETNQFRVDDNDDCVVANPTYDNYTLFECEDEYRYAIHVWRRTIQVNRILNTWKGGPRNVTLNSIRESEQRWENFQEKVTSDQFPWETLANGWLISGTIDTPPRKQLRLFHPVALLSYSEDSKDYDEEIGMEVVGLRSYDKGYNPEWGLSFFALLKSESSAETGYGVSLSRKNFMLGIVAQDSAVADNDTKLILGYNLANLFENTKNDLAQKRTQHLEQLEAAIRELQ